MILSLLIIFTFGFLGGWLFKKIKMPPLIYYILLGILIGPSVLNIVSGKLLNISSILRQIALIIILTRSGLSLNIKTLKQIGRPAVMMCMIPATCEIIGITIFGPLILHISIFEALLLGSVLAAVSPAVVAPRMISLIERNYGENHKVCELVLAGASCDDIFVIVLFYAFKGLVATNSFTPMTLLQIPSSIILGIALGVLFGFIIYFLIKFTKMPKFLKVILFMLLSGALVLIENVTKKYVSISSLLGIITMGIVVLSTDKKSAQQIKPVYDKLWIIFEVLLFVLVGCATDVHYAFSLDGLKIIGLISIALVFRSLGVLLCLIKTNYTWKERLFIIISYLPKATVQASIGGIALAEGLPCGIIILTAAVVSILFTAPSGAILMDTFDKKLLKVEYQEDANIIKPIKE